jgi:hypothetical protein
MCRSTSVDQRACNASMTQYFFLSVLGMSYTNVIAFAQATRANKHSPREQLLYPKHQYHFCSAAAASACTAARCNPATAPTAPGTKHSFTTCDLHCCVCDCGRRRAGDAAVGAPVAAAAAARVLVAAAHRGVPAAAAAVLRAGRRHWTLQHAPRYSRCVCYHFILH